MIKRIFYFSFFVFLTFSQAVWAQAKLDSFFGQDGKVITSIQDKLEDRGETIAQDNKGRIYVAGMTGLPDQIDFFVTRYLPDGKLDGSFGKDGKVIKDLGGADHVHGLVLSPEGKIFVAGYSSVGSKSQLALLAVNPDGSLDSSFGNEGVVKTDLSGWAEAHYAILTPDKKILVAGFVELQGDADFVLVQYQQNGSLDSTFGEAGKMVLDWTRKDRIYGLSLSVGKTPLIYYVTGSALNAGTGEDCIVGAFDNKGNRVKDFGFGGLAQVGFGPNQDACSSLVVQKNGQILVAGYISNKDGKNADYALARLNANGTADSTFGTNGKVTVDFEEGVDVIHDIGLLANGEIIVGGESEVKSEGKYKSRFSLARFDAKGNSVKNWGNKGLLNDTFSGDFPEQAMGLWVDKEGRIVLAGHAQKNVALMRVLTQDIKKKKTR